MPIKQFNDMKYQTFIQQAKDFKQLDFDGNKIIKTISIADEIPPWTVMRAAELLNWIENGEYEKFLPKQPRIMIKGKEQRSCILKSFNKLE